MIVIYCLVIILLYTALFVTAIVASFFKICEAICDGVRALPAWCFNILEELCECYHEWIAACRRLISKG